MGEQVTYYSVSEAEEDNTAGNKLYYLEQSAFDRVRAANLSDFDEVGLFAQMARLNALYMIARAGSGHLGSSFSSLDIVSWLYLRAMKEGDRYFSSKGHDSPALYAVHIALGILPFERLHQLRRLHGLPGHPDVSMPGAVTNTGSLGMGVSKAKGFLYADGRLNRDGHVYVLTGDGELQEGQFWESLIGASRLRDGRLTVIVDHNKLQSDTRVTEVSDLGDLLAKFEAFGLCARECDGHDLEAFSKTLSAPVPDGRPLAIVAHTVKGKGVPFMEHTSMRDEQIYYRFHSGAPTPQDYLDALDHLSADIKTRLDRFGLSMPSLTSVSIDPIITPPSIDRLIPAYSEALLAEAEADDRLVALDADLVLDTGLIPFREQFGPRFIECGIAEQDMVSQAGTMALAGLVPIVHSFACFLTSRASEQIYNNCTERTKIIYVGSLAGVLPAGPGHSHQAVRDIACMSGFPDMVLIEPLSASQVSQALHWCLRNHAGSAYLRLTSIPCPKLPELDPIERMLEGRGTLLREGADAVIVVTNPVLTAEALRAADALGRDDRAVAVIATPWLNRVDTAWYAETLPDEVPLLTVESHYSDAGFGSQFLAAIAEAGLLGNRRVARLGLNAIPQSGRNDEVLRHHGLDADGIAAAVRRLL